MYVQQYVENDLMDKSPVELIRLLYSKAIEKLDQAARHTQDGDVRGRNNCLARVMEIIAELQGTLNLEAGGDLALELARIYDYSQQRMIEAAGAPDATVQLQEVRVLLVNLSEGWNECEPPAVIVQDDASPNAAPEERARGEMAEDDDSDFVGGEVRSPPATADYSGATDGRVWTL